MTITAPSVIQSNAATRRARLRDSSRRSDTSGSSPAVTGAVVAATRARGRNRQRQRVWARWRMKSSVSRMDCAVAGAATTDRKSRLRYRKPMAVGAMPGPVAPRGAGSVARMRDASPV